MLKKLDTGLLTKPLTQNFVRTTHMGFETETLLGHQVTNSNKQADTERWNRHSNKQIVYIQYTDVQNSKFFTGCVSADCFFEVKKVFILLWLVNKDVRGFIVVIFESFFFLVHLDFKQFGK